MSDKGKNGLLPGWPPFAEFKREMVGLVDEAQKPIKENLNIVKESLIAHIADTKKNFQIVKENFQIVKENFQIVKENFQTVKENFHMVKENFQTVNESLLNTNNRISRIEKHLSNHVTDTDEKIDSFREEVNQKLDKLLTK